LNGVVQQTGYDPLLGIFIRLDNGYFRSTYGHLSQLFVLPGDSVAAGNALGISGATGRVTGEHLHFAIKFHGRYIDPLLFLCQIIKLQRTYANSDTSPPAQPSGTR